MKQQLAQLDEFNNRFGVYANEEPTGVIPVEVAELRVKLIREELDEYAVAALSGDLIGVTDALADLLYVVLGTVYAHGLQDFIELAFDEVHVSNLSKLGEDGKPVLREDGKVIKSARYFKPNLAKILESKD